MTLIPVYCTGSLSYILAGVADDGCGLLLHLAHFTHHEMS